ncbi:2-thiouracil desulfurase family protein [Staphylococcus simulans]
MIAVSACLIGDSVRYDGSHKLNDELRQLVQEDKAIALCPEVLGGLSAPRPPAEIVGGDGFDVWEGHAKVIATTGEDVTEAFKQGALETLALLEVHQCTAVILKSKSPSCGTFEIYDGTFSGELKSGMGVCAALLMRHGIVIVNELNWKEKLDLSLI